MVMKMLFSNFRDLKLENLLLDKDANLKIIGKQCSFKPCSSFALDFKYLYTCHCS